MRTQDGHSKPHGKLTLLRAVTVGVVITTSTLSHGAPLTSTQLRSWSEARLCEHSSPGVIVFRGDSADLGSCLAAAGNEEIASLTITSGGGDAWKTLRIMERYENRIDLITVDHLCASSCANYVLPAGKRINVTPDSYIMLHGSIDPAVVAKYIDEQREQLRLRYANGAPADLEAALQRAIDETRRQAAEQHLFEQRTLSCKDWLAPTSHSEELIRPGAEVSWLLVTEVMATRCLRKAHIDSFWSPPPQEALPADLRFLRALY
jgi:hypothetical protein